MGLGYMVVRFMVSPVSTIYYTHNILVYEHIILRTLFLVQIPLRSMETDFVFAAQFEYVPSDSSTVDGNPLSSASVSRT